jgi:hypothetical protein
MTAFPRGNRLSRWGDFMTFKALLKSALFVTLATSCWAAPFTGPASILYLTNAANSTIYEVQGGSVIGTFPETYGGTFSEAVLAISNANGIDTRSYYNLDTGAGGQYTFGGAATGVTYSDPTPSGIYTDFAYDGTSNGVNNFVMEFYGLTPDGSYTENVYETGLDWQNPVALFSVQTDPGVSKGEFEGIAYDQDNNSLWVSGWDDNVIRDYSMTGVLLSSFVPESYSNSALAYDPSDGTLWMAGDATSVLYQYSTTGTLLQSGTPVGLPTGNYLGGDMTTIPEPATMTTLLFGLATLAGWRRKRR